MEFFWQVLFFLPSSMIISSFAFLFFLLFLISVLTLPISDRARHTTHDTQNIGPDGMSRSLSAAEVASLKKVVEAARDDSGVLPDFFKDFLKEWGAKIPAPKTVRYLTISCWSSFSLQSSTQPESPSPG